MRSLTVFLDFLIDSSFAKNLIPSISPISIFLIGTGEMDSIRFWFAGTVGVRLENYSWCHHCRQTRRSPTNLISGSPDASSPPNPAFANKSYLRLPVVASPPNPASLNELYLWFPCVASPPNPAFANESYLRFPVVASPPNQAFASGASLPIPKANTGEKFFSSLDFLIQYFKQ